MSAEVSAVVAAFNAETTIRMCLNALCLQDFSIENYEVIVVDDGSTDDTGKIVRSFSLNKPIKYIRQERAGLAAARNKGVEAAEGSVVLFINPDCVAQIGWIREMTASLKSAGVEAVRGASMTKWKSIAARLAQIEKEEIFSAFERADFVNMTDANSSGYQKDALLRLGGFNASIHIPDYISGGESDIWDTDISHRMAKAGCKTAFVPAAVVNHLFHPDSASAYVGMTIRRGYRYIFAYKTLADRTAADWYLPHGLKFQLLALLLAAAGVPVALISPVAGLYAILFGVISFYLLTLSFTFFALGKDFRAGLLSLPFLLLRAASFGYGLLRGSGRFAVSGTTGHAAHARHDRRGEDSFGKK